jgi:hypothetical protein
MSSEEEQDYSQARVHQSASTALPANSQEAKRFKDLVCLQRIAGFWNRSDALIASLLSATKQRPLLRWCTQDTEARDAVATLLVLFLLHSCFGSRKNEWKLIAQKACLALSALASENGVSVCQEELVALALATFQF